MIEVKAPNDTPRTKRWSPTVFLAGSIEMGVAEKWQDKVVKAFEGEDVTFLNPRRDDWDASWEQSIGNPQFSEQVNWELDNIEAANYIVFYFDPATMSPITLMELGIVSANPVSTIVCCPHGFWRKGNVDILCKRAGIPVVHSLDVLIEGLREMLEE